MIEPTDDELDAVLCNRWLAFSMQATLVRVWVRAAMRDALAKWGTPPAVAGEPVAWRYRPSAVWDDYVLTDDPEKAARARGNGLHVEALCLATPQPVACEPLTDEQVEDLRGEANRGFDIEREHYFKAFRDAEAAHGIKGGQHGTE